MRRSIRISIAFVGAGVTLVCYLQFVTLSRHVSPIQHQPAATGAAALAKLAAAAAVRPAGEAAAAGSAAAARGSPLSSSEVIPGVAATQPALTSVFDPGSPQSAPRSLAADDHRAPAAAAGVAAPASAGAAAGDAAPAPAAAAAAADGTAAAAASSDEAIMARLLAHLNKTRPEALAKLRRLPQKDRRRALKMLAKWQISHFPPTATTTLAPTMTTTTTIGTTSTTHWRVMVPPTQYPRKRWRPGSSRPMAFFTPPSLWPECKGVVCDTVLFPSNDDLHYCGVHSEGYKSHYLMYVHGLLQSKDLHARLGWELEAIDDPWEADIVVCNHFKVERFLADARRKRRQLVIAVEIGDSAYIQTTKSTLSRAEVLGVVKHHSWPFARQYCEGPLKETLVQALVRTRLRSEDKQRNSLPLSRVVGLLAMEGCEEVPEEWLRKVHTAIPSWLTVQTGHRWLHQLAEMRPIRKRKVDVAFAGAVSGNFRKQHRETMLYVLQAIHKKYPQWHFEVLTEKTWQQPFHDLLRRSKIFISPWGFGEWSGKDEEAVLAGAVLVKPLAASMRHVMPMYVNEETCLDVRPDWRNLEAVIVEALGNLSNLQRMQNAGIEALRPFVGYSNALRSPGAHDEFVHMLSNATAVAAEEFAKPWVLGDSR